MYSFLRYVVTIQSNQKQKKTSNFPTLALNTLDCTLAIYTCQYAFMPRFLQG